MKRIIMILALLFIFCSACTPSKNNEKILIEKNDTTYTLTIGETVYSQLEKLYEYSPDLNKKGNILSACVYGKTIGEVTEYNPILVVETNDGLFAEVLDTCATYQPKVFVNDVDGDGNDEIVVNNVRTAMGIGEYRLQVFRTEKDGLTSIFNFPETAYIYNGPESDIPYDKLNLGFIGKLEDGYKLRLEFPSIEYEELISLNEKMIDNSLFDENGTPLSKSENIVKFNTFHSVEVADKNSDGVCEIVGKQNIFYGVLRSIGEVEIILNYNTEIKSFGVVAVRFIPIS